MNKFKALLKTANKYGIFSILYFSLFSVSSLAIVLTISKVVELSSLATIYAVVVWIGLTISNLFLARHALFSN